ncbi:tax1-binding protein 1 homolog B isoform X1 [Alosa sapidissima]|uniref:tax1-binding protein 1 homolog B isoform X1 n=1 Tax=Alosa sapidissima TaxID=34773 RepID=UPI001C0A0FEB|nr:tax1-binding protein 1 homolog B isoform X1 [Alosa sapidissima]
MALHQERPSASSTMETSNFAHVIFQNVGKSYLPHAALECHYTLTQFIKPHPKDWVGIFKVGWSTARDYYTFLWSPMPEELTEGTAINRSVVFQGYYVPNDDGEFYQFCYVSHKGEIRGASTPFQFRSGTPTEDELLAVEDDANSDILVVTTKASFLEQKLEELRVEKEAVESALQEAQQDRQQLEGAMEQLQEQSREAQRERERLTHTLSQEQHTCTQLRTQLQEVQQSSQTLVEEREEMNRRQEEMKRRQEESSVRLLQLEEDLIGVTQRGLQKETQLDSLKDRLKKLNLEKDNLESQLKNEKDEKELYKIHLKNRELENSKLSAELQMVKAMDVNRENTIAQLKDEVARLKACLTDREQQNRQLLASPSAEMKALREQLRQKEEQLNASQQQAAMLGAELRDAASVRDRSMSDLYRVRLEAEQLRRTHADVQAECRRLQQQLQQQQQQQQQGRKENDQQEAEVCEAGALQELQREVEDLRLRLQMAAEHYKDKYKECQRLQKQVLKLSESQGEEKRSPEAAATPLTSSPEPSVPGSSCGSEAVLDTLIQSKLRSVGREANDKSDKYRKIKQMLSEEKERSCVFADELAKMEQKWREQLKTNDSLRLQLAAEEDRYRSQVAEKGRELKDLKDKLAALTLEKERLEGDLQRSASHEEEEVGPEEEELEAAPLFLQYPLPYEPSPLMASDLQFGNPYTRDGADGDEFSDEMLPRLPPMGPPSWDSNVVCIQPARNLSRPDGFEEPETQQSSQPSPTEEPTPPEAPSTQISDTPMPFCFEASGEQKRCPLCEVIFPPHYEQRRFEEHVESHWKTCPMCSEQFPLDCQQQLFEKHVLTHFDANVLNFD